MLRKISVAVAALLFTALGSLASFAEVKPNPLFSDGMVLQRDADAAIWGTAGPEEEISIEFRGNSYTCPVTDGEWKVKIKTLDAGGPFTLKVSGNNTIEIKDVLAGDVWVCGGQSNMAFHLKSAEGGEEAARADDPMLRFYKAQHRGSDAPQTQLTGEWSRCAPETAAGFSAVGYYFGSDLRKALDVPIGLISIPVGGSIAEAWISAGGIRATPAADYFVEYFKERATNYDEEMAAFTKAADVYLEKVQKAESEGAPKPPAPAHVRPMSPDSDYRPSCLYNGMIAPLIPFCIKGVIWYQGETNALLADAYPYYGEVFPALIKDWRAQWGQGDFPFLFVLLPRFGTNNIGWVAIREAQIGALSLPNTGLASPLDIDDLDLHPRRKQPVGERLALCARGMAYGEDITYLGPAFESAAFDGPKAIVKFRNAKGGLKVKGDSLGGFQIAGQDGRFFRARANVDGDAVIVSEPAVPEPVAVRYAWESNPDANLFNAEGIPALPFRTDAFTQRETSAAE